MLSVELGAEYPDNPDDPTTSGHYLGAQTPLPGSMLTFTPAGGSPVPATASDPGDTNGKGKSDDGLFDATYSFVVPGNLTTGSLMSHLRHEVLAAQPAVGRAHRGGACRLSCLGRKAGEEERALRDEKNSPHSPMTPSRPDYHRTPIPDLRPRRVAQAAAGPPRCLAA